jgi:phosphatidylglycerol:prolipoprotein diacylglycerol transferase
MALLAFVCGYLVIRADLGRRGIDERIALDLTLCAYVGGWLGARVWLIPGAWNTFSLAPLRFLLSPSGWVWYGGVVGGAGAVALWTRWHAFPFLLAADVCAPALAIGLAIGRIGCHLAGDGDYGLPSALPWAMRYPNGLVPTQELVHPVPLYEMVGLSVIFAWLWHVGRRAAQPGGIFARYLVASAILRFVLEYVRRTPAMLLGHTPAQWVSVGAFTIGAYLLWRPGHPAS